MACVVSHKHKFIFIHVPRTGGTAFLSPFSVYWDLLGDSDHTPIWHRRIGYFKSKFPKEWRKYFKFAFVRNPLDRMISMWIIKGRKEEGFVDFMKSIKADPSREPFCRPQSHWIGDGSELDYVARFENYSRETAYLAGKIGFPLMHLDKVRVTPGRLHYADYYGQDALEVALHLCKQDMENFDYGKSSNRRII